MRRVGAWGGIMALILGLGMAAAAAEEPDGDSKSAPAKNGWWAGWFGDKPKGKFKADQKTSLDDKPAPPNAAELAGLEQKRQMDAALRRAQVCLRLRQIADDTNNADLQRQAEELEARAWEIYRLRTAHLTISAQPLDADMKTTGDKPTTKRTIGRSSLNGQKPGDKSPAMRSIAQPADARERPDMDFELREQNALRGTIMGRDRP